ncbi:MAG TPA: nickel pincer cofactor biosynthesis protein LarC [Tichowtungia sp.]|nr:nickel pincer cofactor biosynthesis protein LarC [Tichowtungia sp.]
MKPDNPPKQSSTNPSTLYLSCYSGISGNMMIGVLLDAGLPEEALRKTIGALPVSGYELTIERVAKNGIAATHFDVTLDPNEKQPHRHLRHIVEIINDAKLSDSVKERSIAVFTKLAEAEANVHGTTVEKIHFHEVGAVDAIIDVVGTVSGLEALGIEQIYAGNLRTGFGFVECAHGQMPIPAPATAELLAGIAYTQGTVEKELITPTGAALVAVLCDGFGDRPDGFITEKTAYGAGGYDLEIPNVLRAEAGCIRRTRHGQLGELSLPQNEQPLVLMETNIDDCSPQVVSYAMDRLFEAGALDVWQTPILMKKGRSGVKLSILCSFLIKNEIENLIFRETTSIGIRSFSVERTALERREETVETPWGPVRIKVSSLNGTVCSATPEYEDCRELAGKNNIPLKTILEAAQIRQPKK